MSEIDAEVVRRLVTGHKNDGRAVYDPQAKAEVVRACQKPGVSVARMALQCGINANLLRRWITQSMGADTKTRRANMPTVAVVGTDAFVPLRLAAPGAVPATAAAAAALKLRLHARLPNGVEVDLSDAGPGEWLPFLELLGRLPCSDSTTR
ncbi:MULTISPECIES: transposase [Pseudomonadota]|jgi:transposase-like protein|uniref:transposase n=1 Tax=Pseudomonadota TaxID=1224 RepID=UPI0015F52DCC|nr:transposase [Hydrogenophaga sp.]MBP6614717.1 transposase [Aquabacterium sp.]MDO9482265.1 transposase [Hydrogenophaga sp.]MDP3805630.1 transposase [Hydrogenophaga sp.]MDZ4291867.1 transposase [Hydrogenophaga sp.]